MTQSGPRTPTTARLLAQAVAHHQAGRLPEAEKAYRKLLRADGGNGDGLRLLGGLYLQSGQPGRAAEYLEKADRLAPGNPEILSNLGIAWRNLGRLDDAIASYRKALAVKPDYPQALHNLGSAYYQQGRLAEAEPCYRRALQAAPDYAQAHYNLGNVLRDRNAPAAAVAHYEQALRLRPDYVDALTNLALALGQLGEAEKAGSVYIRALELQPDNPVLLNNYGNLLRGIGRFAEAKALYQQAIRLKPDYLNAHINMGTVERDLGNLDAALGFYRHVLAAQPNAVAALNNLGTVMQDLGRLEDALELYDRALGIQPDSIEALWNKGLVHLAMGDLPAGWALYDSGLGIHDKRGPMRFPPRLLWRGEPLDGKRLLICSEQGHGDALQFVRYAALCKQRGGEIVVLCGQALMPLFANCPFIDRLTAHIESDAFDYCVPMMSLPGLFGTTLETIPAQIPYLFVDAAAREKWAARVGAGGRRKIGLVWAGGIREHQPFVQLIDKRRSMHLSQFAPLLEEDGVDFYSLQIGPPAAQIEACGLTGRLIDLTAEIGDFEDTAALIERLDLVIAVDTAVAHLAGALGKPVWVLSRFDACWRWLRNRAASPWYPSMRIFGQPAPGAWEPVVERVREELMRF